MSDDEEYCVYVAGVPFGAGSCTKEECEEICKILNDDLKQLMEERDGGE